MTNDEQIINNRLVTWSSEDEPELVAQGNTITEEGEGLTNTNKLFFEAIDKRTNPVNVCINQRSQHRQRSQDQKQPISILFQFICSGANHHGENTDTVKIDENDDPVCCANVDAGNLGTGKSK